MIIPSCLFPLRKSEKFLMECAFGLKGKDFAIVACDGHVDFSIINFKKDEDKIRIVCRISG